MRERIRLTDDEIRTGLIFAEHFVKAQARAEMAHEAQNEYVAILRAKYGLGNEWTFSEFLSGFVRADVETIDGGTP